MASARITCPDCKSVLKPAKPVPDGKQVKCPKCGNLFYTPGHIEQVEQLPRKSKKTSGKKAKAGIKKASGSKPPPKKSVHDDDEDEGGIYSFVGAKQTHEEEEKPEIEYAPDMSIKDLRGPAQEAIVKPSNLIMLICGLSALSNIFLICWSFWPMVFSESVVDWQKALKDHFKDDKAAISRIEQYKEFKELKDKDLEIVQDANDEAAYGFPNGRVWLLGGFILLLIYNAIVMVGGVKMQNLESRRWSIASSILMLLPMGGGGLSCLFALGVSFLEQMTGFLGELSVFYSIVLGAVPYLASLFVGVMSLRALMSQEVIDGFEYVAE
jgi:predicted Zn finger-like uncharacterized protein